jgi:hypothetical protein
MVKCFNNAFPLYAIETTYGGTIAKKVAKEIIKFTACPMCRAFFIYGVANKLHTSLCSLDAINLDF